MGDQTQAGVSEGGIRRSARTRTRKKKKNQIPMGILAFLVIAAIGILLNRAVGARVAIFWILGNAFGFILQRSRFCFTASMRDPYLTGSTSLTKSVLAAFAVTTIGFAAIKYGAFAQGLPIPGQSYVVPFGVHTMVGGFMFGIGMVIAGGCASGTLMRVGEGFGMQFLSPVLFHCGFPDRSRAFRLVEINFHRPESLGVPPPTSSAGSALSSYSSSSSHCCGSPPTNGRSTRMRQARIELT